MLKYKVILLFTAFTEPSPAIVGIQIITQSDNLLDLQPYLMFRSSDVSLGARPIFSSILR